MTIRDAAAFFRENDHYCILTHRGPDGDTVGCAAALCRGLRALGKTAYVLENPQLTQRYAPWLAGLTAPAGGGCIVSVDLASEGLLPENAQGQAGNIRFAIDHHGSNTRFAHESLVEPGAAACGELIYALLRELGVTPDREIAGALYVALSTDTGCFQYSNTTANTLRVAAELLELGVDAAAINRALFGVKTLRRLRLEAKLTESVCILAGGLVAVCRVPLSLVEELSLTEDDLDSLAGFSRAIEGVEVGVTLREKPGGLVRLSIRSGPGYNACAICSHMGGGGHSAAAGATLENTTLDGAFQQVCKALSLEGLEV